MLTIGKRIKTLRVLYWLSQQEFAKRIGVSRRQVAYWESEHDTPSAERIPQICKVLNVSADWLLSGGALRSVYDHRAALKRRDERILRGAVEFMRLLNHLPTPEDFEKTAAIEMVPALEEDIGSFAVRLPDNSLAPAYNFGDLLYFRPLNIALPAPVFKIAPLEGQQVALTLNGESFVRQFNVQPRKPHSHTVQLTSIGKRRTRYVARPEDSLVLHGVAYKCVRSL